MMGAMRKTFSSRNVVDGSQSQEAVRNTCRKETEFGRRRRRRRKKKPHAPQSQGREHGLHDGEEQVERHHRPRHRKQIAYGLPQIRKIVPHFGVRVDLQGSGEIGQKPVALLVEVPHADLGVLDDLPFPRFERRPVAALAFTVAIGLRGRLFHA